MPAHARGLGVLGGARGDPAAWARGPAPSSPSHQLPPGLVAAIARQEGGRPNGLGFLSPSPCIHTLPGPDPVLSSHSCCPRAGGFPPRSFLVSDPVLCLLSLLQTIVQ